MEQKKQAWDKVILDQMETGAVTFAWDNGDIETVHAPEGQLKTMESAWAWIDPKLRDYEKGKGKPRQLCFRLDNGIFRGLKFPDGVPGMM